MEIALFSYTSLNCTCSENSITQNYLHVLVEIYPKLIHEDLSNMLKSECWSFSRNSKQSKRLSKSNGRCNCTGQLWSHATFLGTKYRASPIRVETVYKETPLRGAMTQWKQHLGCYICVTLAWKDHLNFLLFFKRFYLFIF